MALTLHGFHYSVYVRIVRMVMLEKNLSWEHLEVDPFGELPSSYLDLNPFGRVPTLVDDGFILYETTAITRYLDDAHGGHLQPKALRQRARMNQIIAVADSYAYWPLVRQVYAQRVFAPALGQKPDEEQIEKGLKASRTILEALEGLTSNEEWLCSKEISLADFHLGGLIGCFATAPEGRRILNDIPRIAGWWERFHNRRSFTATDPGLPRTE